MSNERDETRSEWIECPRCQVIRSLKRGEPDECSFCGWIFAAGETGMALEAAGEWEVVRALGASRERERRAIELLKRCYSLIDHYMGIEAEEMREEYVRVVRESSAQLEK